MSRLKQAVKMLRYNFSSIAFFEIVYRVLSLAILTPAMYGLLNVSMDIAGVSYLSSGTIYRYMRSPITYVAFLLILILIAFFLLINLSGIIYSMEASVRREKLNPMDILLHGIRFYAAVHIGCGIITRYGKGDQLHNRPQFL